MTKNRDFKRRVRLRASKTGESYTSARSRLVPADRSRPIFEEQRPADYLQRAAASAAGQAYKSAAIERLTIEPDNTVLDAGCGTGGELAALLRLLGPRGSLIGVDIDPDALETARQLVVDPRLSLVEGDVHDLPLQHNSIDRIYVDRTAQHVSSPSLMLTEFRRLLVPGGLLVVAEPDWQTLVIDSPEPILADSYRRYILEQVIRNARIGSEVPRLAHGADLVVESVTPFTATYTNQIEGDRIFGFARVTRRAVDAGYLDRDEADRWLGYLTGRTFFASLTIFVTTARCRS